jgi:hypothetical protein
MRKKGKAKVKSQIIFTFLTLDIPPNNEDKVAGQSALDFDASLICVTLS